MSGAEFDVIIIGGGPAGLSAALMLGRCRRSLLLCDDGRPRNWASCAVHGFLTRDGIDPAEFRSIAHEQLRPYQTVELRQARVINAVRQGRMFEVTLDGGATLQSRTLLLATGLMDKLPDIPNVEDFYGRSVHHCPYCDGWGWRDQPIAAYGRGDENGGDLALKLTLWSQDVVLCTNGPSELTNDYRQRVARHGIEVREERITGLEGAAGTLESIVFEGGKRLTRHALFFNTQTQQASDLAKRLACEFDEQGGVAHDQFGLTSVSGVYVAGDASRDMLQVIVGAAQGAEAAVEINAALLKEDLV
jgi:thioredoxin reductase